MTGRRHGLRGYQRNLGGQFFPYLIENEFCSCCRLSRLKAAVTPQRRRELPPTHTASVCVALLSRDPKRAFHYAFCGSSKVAGQLGLVPLLGWNVGPTRWWINLKFNNFNGLIKRNKAFPPSSPWIADARPWLSNK